MSSVAFVRVRAALGSRIIRDRNGKIGARCPAHPDRKPSLSVTDDPVRVLVHCFAGCRFENVLLALNLTVRDLRNTAFNPSATTSSPTTIEAFYPYRTLDGELYARKVRTGPVKRFYWERQIGQQRWKHGLAGSKPTLYRINELVGATRALIAEGEKAVDLLCRHGFQAACPPFGAGKWDTAWSEDLWSAGVREIVFLRDEDAEGRKFIARAQRACLQWRPSAAEADESVFKVKGVPLPGLGHGEDVHDWLTKHGHNAADLEALIAAVRASGAGVDRAAEKRALAAARQRRFRERRRLAAARGDQ